jgi:hypothetical protein
MPGNKQTKDELASVTAELDAMADDGSEQDPDDQINEQPEDLEPIEQPVKKQAPVTPVEPQKPDIEPVEPQDAGDVQPGEEGEPQEQEQDWKKKFSESAAEAQRIADEQKVISDAFAASQNVGLPTDEECVQRFGEDFLNESELTKSMARQSLQREKKDQLITGANQLVEAKRRRLVEIKGFAFTPDNQQSFPLIKGREDEFIKFANKESRKGMDLEDIATFFTSWKREQLAHTPQKQVSRQPLMERGNRATLHNSVDRKPSAFGADKVKTLRQADAKAYGQMIKSKQITPQMILDAD